MAAFYIIKVYKKAIGFVGLGNNLGYLLYKIRYLFCRIGAPKFNKSEVILGHSRYLKTSNYVINGPWN